MFSGKFWTLALCVVIYVSRAGARSSRVSAKGSASSSSSVEAKADENGCSVSAIANSEGLLVIDAPTGSASGSVMTVACAEGYALAGGEPQVQLTCEEYMSAESEKTINWDKPVPKCVLKDIDECSPNPCVHGTCTDGINTYTCTCDDGYTGTNCDTDIDECSPNPCVHGTCTDGIDSYTCNCDDGYTGTDCDTAYECNVDCAGDIVMILDRSGSMASVLEKNRGLMNAVAQNLSIGECRTFVSLLFVYATPSLMWGFDSYHTNSSDSLQYGFDNFPTDEATGPYLYLGPGLDFARTSILPTGRTGAADMVIMFWDGDDDLSTEAAKLHADKTSVISVSSILQTGIREANVQSIVTTLDDMFYLSDASFVESFVERVNQKLSC